MSNLEKLVTSAQRHKGFLDGIQKDILRIRGELAQKEMALEQMQKHLTDMNWCYNYLDLLVKSESNRFITRLEELLDYGIKTIFYDRNYSIRVVVEDNKRVSIHLVYTDEDGNEITPDIKDCGGGVRTVVGVLLQIFFLFHYDSEKILIVDEGFSNVSSDYLPNLFGLIAELAEKNSLRILLITHDDRMKGYANRHYIVTGHEVRLANNN